MEIGVCFSLIDFRMKKKNKSSKPREGKVMEWVMKSARKYLRKHFPATEWPESRIKFRR